ncbi:MAG: hypothetical protein AB7O65_08430 [Candidatus Korobacteraceae bacterium]
MNLVRSLSVALLGLTFVLPAFAEDFPVAEIRNGEIQAKIYLPNARDGFYRTTRFDWSGAIASLQYKGHEYYGVWWGSIDPDVYDLDITGPEVVNAPFTAMVGPAEEFGTNGAALGWEEAAPGGTFIKFGVGVLRKPNNSDRYDHSKPYEIVDPGNWMTKKTRDSVEFTQTLTDPSSGYGYMYRKVVRLVKGRPQMVIEHSLRNTGKKQIVSTVYNHNFLTLDKQPPGPDFVLTFPFELQAAGGRPLNPELGEIRGNQIRYRKVLEKTDRLSGRFSGFSDKASDYDIRVESTKVGAGYRVTADRPMSNLVLWSIRTTLCIEPYNAMTIDPGKEFTWNLTYDYYTLDKRSDSGR